MKADPWRLVLYLLRGSGKSSAPFSSTMKNDTTVQSEDAKKPAASRKLDLPHARENSSCRVYRCLVPVAVSPGYLVAVALIVLAGVGAAPSLVTSVFGRGAIDAIGPMGAAAVVILVSAFVFAVTFVLHRAARLLADIMDLHLATFERGAPRYRDEI